MKHILKNQTVEVTVKTRECRLTRLQKAYCYSVSPKITIIIKVYHIFGLCDIKFMKLR